MVLAAADEEVQRVEIWLVILPFVGAATATRLGGMPLPVSAGLLVSGLGLGIFVAVVLFPGSQLIYALPPVVLIANVVLGESANLVSSLLASS